MMLSNEATDASIALHLAASLVNSVADRFTSARPYTRRCEGLASIPLAS